MDRNVPVLLQLLVPGKSRHRSTPITACRTQRRSAPSLLGATLVATVNQLIKQLFACSLWRCYCLVCACAGLTAFVNSFVPAQSFQSKTKCTQSNQLQCITAIQSLCIPTHKIINRNNPRNPIRFRCVFKMFFFLTDKRNFKIFLCNTWDNIKVNNIRMSTV